MNRNDSTASAKGGGSDMDAGSVRQSTWFLRCICGETRFAMLEMLRDADELSVGDFASHLKTDQPLISHHLKKLRECGILATRQEGKKVMYRISSRKLAGLIAEIADAGKMIPHLCDDGGEDDGNGRACGC